MLVHLLTRLYGNNIVDSLKTTKVYMNIALGYLDGYFLVYSQISAYRFNNMGTINCEFVI